MPLTCRTCFQLDDPFVLDLIINNKCFRMDNPCESCRVFLLRQKEMPLEVAVHVIDDVLKLVYEKQYSSLGIAIRGGDVFASFDLMKQIYDYASQKSMVPLHFLIDGSCGFLNEAALLWVKEADARVYLNFTHDIITNSPCDVCNYSSSDCTAHIYARQSNVKHLAEDIFQLKTIGLSGVQVHCVDYGTWRSVDMKRLALERDKLIEYIDMDNGNPIPICNLFDKEQLFYEDILDEYSMFCPIGEGVLTCVDIDGATYSCARCSPLFMLRSISQKFAQPISPEIIKDHGKECCECKYHPFCKHCPADFQKDIDKFENQSSPNYWSKAQCWLAKFVLTSTLKLYAKHRISFPTENRNLYIPNNNSANRSIG